MSQVTLEFPDPFYDALKQAATDAGLTPAEWILKQVTRQLQGNGAGDRPPRTEEQLRAARARFRKLCGAVHSGDSHFADNERIDDDLAREYAGQTNPDE